MAWAKLDDGLDEHPKVEQLLERDEVDGLAAVGLWTLLLAQTSRRLEEGRFTRRQLVKLAPDDGERLLELLVDVGLVDIDGRAWRIHGYMDHNPPKAEVLAKRAAQSERNRIAAERRWARERERKAAATAAAGQLPGQIPIPLSDAPPHAPAHSESHAGAHSDAPAHTGVHAERYAPPAMLPSRPVPSPIESESAGARALFDSTTDPLDAIRSIDAANGNDKFAAAWPMERDLVIYEVSQQSPGIQRQVADRLLDEHPRWKGNGVRHWVCNDWIPDMVDREKSRAAAQPKAAAHQSTRAERRRRAGGKPAHDFDAAPAGGPTS